MANENVRNLRDATIILQDAGGINTLTVICEAGDLSWTETSDIKVIKDRNRLSHMRLGEEEPVALSFSIRYKYSIANAGEPLSPYEIFHNIDGASAWVTTNICGDVFTIDIKFVLNDPCAAGEDEYITFRRVPLPGINFEEGDESSTMTFDSIAFMTRPEIYRGSSTTTTTTTGA